MSGPALVHVVVSGLATGCIYALVALSLVIVYNATRTVNFAQGEMLMVSAFVAWTAQHTAGLPLLAALACGVAAGGLLAFLVERAIIRRAVSATHWDVLIITLGLSLALRAAAGIVWTNEELPFPALFSNRPVAIGPVRVAPVSLGVIGASLVLMLALVALFRATRFGRAMRAVAQNQTAARLMGISVERVYSGAWVLAAVVGGVAGVLVAPVIFLSPRLGWWRSMASPPRCWAASARCRRGAGRHAPRGDREPRPALPADQHPLLGALPRHHRHPLARPRRPLGSVERRKV